MREMRCRIQQQPIFESTVRWGNRHPDESVGPTPTVRAKVPSKKKKKKKSKRLSTKKQNILVLLR